MATYRALAGTTYGSRTNTTINKPTGTVEGDQMRMYFILGASSAAGIPTPTWPSGWSVIVGPTTVSQDNSAAQFSIRSWTLEKAAGASEPSSYTITHSAASSDGVIISVQSGAADTGNGTANDGDGTGNVSFTALSTAAANSCVIACCHNWQLWGSGTAPSGGNPTFTERQDSASSLVHVSTSDWSGSGTTGTLTKDSDNAGSADQWAAHLVAVENSVGSKSPPPRRRLTRFFPSYGVR